MHTSCAEPGISWTWCASGQLHSRLDPIHEPVMFLANLEFGYFTPPVGLNLYLSSSRFGKPLTVVTRNAFPFLLIMAVSVLLITCLPNMLLGIPKLLGKYEAPALAGP